MKTKIIALTLFALFLGGCASVHVRPVQASQYPIKLVYIQQNPKVGVEDFVRVVEDGFQRHGIETKVITGEPPADSDFVLSYTATRFWTMAGSFLKDAELRLNRGTKQVAVVTYHHRGALGLTKWTSTQTKMNPVIDELLADFPVQ